MEPAAWTERMLAALESGVKGGRWFSLMDKVYAPKNLAAAWKRVRGNRGAGGVDGQSVAQFDVRLQRRVTSGVGVPVRPGAPGL